MFWRILWRLFSASRARLAVAMLAVASGATVCSALLNLELDARHKLTREFRALGANVIVVPKDAVAGGDLTAALLDESVSGRLGAAAGASAIATVPVLYLNAQAVPQNDSGEAGAENGPRVIVAGTWLDALPKIAPGWKVKTEAVPATQQPHCLVGVRAAEKLGLTAGAPLGLRHAGREEHCAVTGIVTAGGPEDSQVFLELAAAQRLAHLEGRVSLVQLSVPGTPEAIEAVRGRLAAAAPGAEVRPVRQLAEAEGRLLARIEGLILATVGIILVLTALCVMATMATLAMERRRDVGLMKALGGPMRGILRLFLVEAGTLGLTGGVLGCVLGYACSGWLGRRVFGTSASPRIEVLPVTLLLMAAVAIAGAFPLRLLARVRPAEILRGDR